ncbi:pleckstrin-like domain-containing family G member 4B-like [Scleropages formosus]|uniref:Pleckstrin-like domain-containing family G member 4B-like n=1 Tax=Scleropages formosus TaxID=113540 RepID=A0A0P7USN2_SCLFO|nr:pleckstrin-like domain-containing family G member 4B-like [Scleropages formosus]
MARPVGGGFGSEGREGAERPRRGRSAELPGSTSPLPTKKSKHSGLCGIQVPVIIWRKLRKLVCSIVTHSDKLLCSEDSKSLDSCIQSTLSSLYPPFSATAATVLWQLFSVVERQYRGDGLRCLVDFLLPAKRVLQTIQQETSLRFKGLLFYHEGWPLCIHEKVVLQLAPLHKVRLRQGDFYLQVVPLGRKAVKLVIKCLSPSGQAIVEIPVAESMYVVYRTPWKNVVNPLLVSSTTDAVMQARRGGSFRAHLSTCSTSGSTGTLDSHRSSRESLHSQGAESTVSEPGPPRGLMGTALPPRPREHQPHNPERKAVTTKPGLSPLATVGKAQDGESGGPRSLSIGTDLSNPGPRRRHPRDSAAFETRRLFRKSYMEALQNPMNLGSSSESILEEGSEQSSPPTPKEDSVSLTSGASDTRSPRRTTPKGWLGGEEPQSHSSILSIQRGLKTPELSRSERRAKSLERTNKASQVKGHRARSSSGGSDSSPLKKSMNGYALKFRKLDLETAFQAAERRSFIKDDSGLHGSGSDTERRRNSHSGEVPQSPKPTSATPKQQFGIPPAPPTDCVLPRLVSEVNQELLLSGAVILPGNRDRSGRAVLQVCTRNSVWSSESFTAKDLTCLFGYYYTTLRKEKRDQGIIMLMDTRRQQPSQLLLASLSELQCELLTSLKALQKHVDASHLTRDLEGSFAYDHNHWVQFRRKIEPFASSCRSAVSSLQSSIATLSSGGKLHTAKDVEEVIDQQKRLMKSVLDDTHLIQLRLEGGTVLARIRKEEACENDGYRDAVDLVSVLYNQVDEEVHKLVILSNKSLKRLENLLETRRFEEGSAQQHQKRGLQLIRESKMIPSATLSDFKQYLSSVLARTERRKAELDLLLNLYEFYDSADQWMEHCQDYLQSLSTDNSNSPFTPAVVQVLQDYHHEATKFSPENFSSLNEMVLNLSSARELKQWNDLWHKCQETREELEEALARAQVALEAPEPVEARVPSKGSSCLLSDITPPDPRAGLSLDSEDARTPTPSPFCRGPPAFPIAPPPGSPKSEGPSRRPSLFDDTDSDCTIDSFASCQSEPAFSPATRHRKQPLKKIMKKTMSYELSTREAGHTEVSLHGYTGVYIKGLEVANNVCVEKKYQRPDIKSPGLGRSRSMSSPAGVNCRHMEEDKKQSNKVQHIMDEMIATEREYVRSLTYIIENYFPEMERADLPQDLRGKRSIIFGNLEKLCDFHGQYFLKELERCAHAPLSVSSCFLHYEDQFGMYALYSKNKPQSDALLTSHGNGFFKNKQVELGDKMDLASYLLKPIQRMSKYALLLKDLIKECSHSQEQELSDLRTAEEMVKFQLRHGNDLLAMDAIRGCDVRMGGEGKCVFIGLVVDMTSAQELSRLKMSIVNLKEQGQLRCQDEFVVWCGRRKYLRHVFLFEDLILFSKTKKIDGGYDIYIYKQSYKTAEIGMTENVGDSGLRFEIWFRRRKSQDTFILQASSVEVKATWTSIIGKILWRQALRNRELRMQEMVSMGIGNKPFMDIKPSEAAISDRAIDYTMKGSGYYIRKRDLILHPLSPNTSSSSSHSSSSLLGSLNLHLYPSPAHSLPGGASFGHWPYDCIEEDELEQDSGRQPSMITESSETSSQCTSSDSVGGLNGLTLPPSAAIAMDTFSSDVASPLHSSPFSSSSSPPSPAPPPVLFQKDQDLQSQGSSFITAVSILSGGEPFYRY